MRILAIFLLLLIISCRKDSSPPVARCQTDKKSKRVSDIQGTKMNSTVSSHTEVTIEGVVTMIMNIRPEETGFFIQDLQPDGDPNSSNGIFVQNPTTVRVGDLVQVSGNVYEYYRQAKEAEFKDMTQLVATSLTLCASNQQIKPLEIRLPITNWEALEGMLVTFSEQLTVINNEHLGWFGKLTLANKRIFHPNSDGDANTKGNPIESEPNQIVLDDANEVKYPKPIPFLSSNDNNGTRRIGDTIAGLTGVVTQGWGGYQLQTSKANFTASNARPTPVPKASELRVASFNVENYFTTFGSRGANNQTEFERQQAKIVAAIKEIDADVLGLIEIENNATALNDLIVAINRAYGQEVYKAVAQSPTELSNYPTKTAFIYKNTLEMIQNPISLTSPIFERYPLAQTFRHQTGGIFSVIINHFKSKTSCEDIDPDIGQGCWNLKRTEQSKALLSFVDRLQKLDQDVLVIGDFNAYPEEDPIKTLIQGGLQRISNGYSYVFANNAGALDHALVTDHLKSQIAGVNEWHINADEPKVIDYNLESKSDDRYSSTPYRSSDHDPLIIDLNLKKDNSLQPGFSLSGPNEIILAQGGKTEEKIKITRRGNFDKQIDFSIEGLPNGIKADFSSTIDEVKMTIELDRGVKEGDYPLILLAKGGNLEEKLNFILKITISGSDCAQDGAKVVISEFRLRGPKGTSDEFIELFNRSCTTIDISGYKLQAMAGTSTNFSDRATIANGQILQSGQHYLVATNDYSLSITPDQKYGSGISDNRAIRLVDKANNVIDLVGFASSTVFEGSGLANGPSNPSTQISWKRQPTSGSDSDNNLNDFKLGTDWANPQNNQMPADKNN